MKYHTLFVIFEKAAKFEIVVCCKLWMALKGLFDLDKRGLEKGARINGYYSGMEREVLYICAKKPRVLHFCMQSIKTNPCDSHRI